MTGNGIVGGNARIEEEASVYDGTINEDARLGALTLIEDRKTHIHGKADIAAAMNAIHGADLSGSVRLIGDIEMNTQTLSKGVFYGMVNPEMASNPRWGSERTAPARDVTLPPARVWPD